MSESQFRLLTAGLIALALALAYRALLQDWVRRRRRSSLRVRRCPKCWHELGPGALLRCPECGRTARSDRQTLKSRRRWRMALLALLVGAGAVATASRTTLFEHGIVGMLPTTVLVGCSALELAPGEFFPDDDSGLPVRMHTELCRRARADALWNWQWNWWTTRALDRLERDGDDRGFADTILAVSNGKGHLSDAHRDRADAMTRLDWCDIRPDWPVGATISAMIIPRHWSGGDLAYEVIERSTGATLISDTHMRSSLATWMPGSPMFFEWRSLTKPVLHNAPALRGLDITVKQRVRDAPADAWRDLPPYDTTLPIVVGGSIEDHLDPVTSSALTEVVSALRPRIYSCSATTMRVDLRLSAQSVFDRHEVDVMALYFEVRRDDEVIASGAAWHAMGPGIQYPSLAAWNTPILIPLDLHTPASSLSQGPLSLRISGDPWTALRHRTARTYWDGDVTVPLSISGMRRRSAAR